MIFERARIRLHDADENLVAFHEQSTSRGFVKRHDLDVQQFTKRTIYAQITLQWFMTENHNNDNCAIFIKT